MMYDECLSCPKLGISCDGPNFVAMSARDLLEWCKQRKARLGLTNAKLSEMSHVPKGTIDRLFSGDHMDFKFETVRPLLRCLVGGSFDGNPCPAPDDNENQHLHEIIEQQKESIRLLEEENNRMLEFFQGQLAANKKYIITLAILLGVTLLVIIAALIVDRLNPNIGFFWRMFNGSTHNIFDLFKI